jgi:hypothetical protein
MNLHNFVFLFGTTICYRAAKIKHVCVFEFHRTLDIPTFFYRQFVLILLKDFLRTVFRKKLKIFKNVHKVITAKRFSS